jgi:hypothetical protein
VNGGLIPVQIRATLLLQKSWQHAGITSAYAWSQRILHVHPKATAKATSFHVHPRKAKASSASLAPYRQLQWRKGTSRQCQRRDDVSVSFNDISVPFRQT